MTGEIDYAIEQLSLRCDSEARIYHNAYKRAAEKFYTSVSGNNSRAKEQQLEAVRDPLWDYTHILEYHSFYRGFTIAQNYAKGDDILQDTPNDYEQLIAFASGQEIGQRTYDQFKTQLDIFRSAHTGNQYRILSEYCENYLAWSQRRCAYYLLAGYMAAVRLLIYNYKDFKLPMAHIEKLIRQLPIE